MALAETDIASATTGCWPAPIAPPTSRGRASCSPCRPPPNSPIRPPLQRQNNRTCCRGHAPVAADACSSSRPSPAAASPSTDQRRSWQRSGSIPHYALAADPRPHRYPPFRPALARQRCRLSRLRSLARARSANPAQQPAIGSFTPVQTPKLLAKATRLAVSAQPRQRSRRHQIPIASAAPLGAPLPRDFVPWRFTLPCDGSVRKVRDARGPLLLTMRERGALARQR